MALEKKIPRSENRFGYYKDKHLFGFTVIRII